MVNDLRRALVEADLDAVAEALAPDVVWVGVLPRQLCRNREQVLGLFRRRLEQGLRVSPEIVGDVEDVIVVDPHLEPPAERFPSLHQVYVVDDGMVVELRDYPDRRSALEAVGLVLQEGRT